MCIYIYIYMYLYIYIYIYKFNYSIVYVNMIQRVQLDIAEPLHRRGGAHMYTCLYKIWNTYTYIYIYIYIYICKCVYIYIYTHTHTYIYIYIYIHIHTYIHTYSLPSGGAPPPRCTPLCRHLTDNSYSIDNSY